MAAERFSAVRWRLLRRRLPRWPPHTCGQRRQRAGRPLAAALATPAGRRRRPPSPSRRPARPSQLLLLLLLRGGGEGGPVPPSRGPRRCSHLPSPTRLHRRCRQQRLLRQEPPRTRGAGGGRPRQLAPAAARRCASLVRRPPLQRPRSLLGSAPPLAPPRSLAPSGPRLGLHPSRRRRGSRVAAGGRVAPRTHAVTCHRLAARLHSRWQLLPPPRRRWLATGMLLLLLPGRPPRVCAGFCEACLAVGGRRRASARAPRGA